MDQMTKNALWYKKELEQTEVKLREARDKQDYIRADMQDDINELQSKLAQAVQVLVELKHLNHHTIEEEIWRIDNVLEDIERSE